MAELDHVVIGCLTLEEGGDYIEEHLGIRPRPGGQHIGWGTHNLLLGLGPECYLEVKAPDPDRPHPGRPRPFNLDDPALHTLLEASPRLITWVARSPALEPAVARLGPRGGEVEEMTRNGLTWLMAFAPPQSGMDGLVPAMLQWKGDGAASRLPDSGCRLLGLEGEHPDPAELQRALAERGLDEAMRVRPGPQPRLVVRLRRPDGVEVALSSR